MNSVERIVILYPGHTSSERINNPANYSFSRLLLLLHDTDDIPIYFLNQSNRYEKYGNIEFSHFTPVNFIRTILRCVRRTNTLVITQTPTYLRYALLMRSILPSSKLLVRLGGVYYGESHLNSTSFEKEVISELKYLRRADMVISTADGTPVDLYMKRVGISKANYRKWLNGFPIIENTGTYRRTDQIVCISRLSPVKGVDYVIRSYAMARPAFNRYQKLVIVGGGEEMDNLKSLAQQLGVAEDVEFVGESYDVQKHLYSSKLLVSGLANNSIMEAIATRTPVIALELGETATLYGHYPNVYVVRYPPGGYGRIPLEHMDSICRETADVMARILNDYPHEDRSRGGDSNELFSWEDRLRQELELYESMFKTDAA